MKYSIYDYESDESYVVKTNWEDDDIAGQSLENDIKEIKKLKIGESYVVSDFGVAQGIITRVK